MEVTLFRISLILIAGFIHVEMTLSQNSDLGENLFPEIMVESIGDGGHISPDYVGLLEELESLRDNPLNLNTATEDDLRKLPFLTDFQISCLLEYRSGNGNLLSIYELSLIHGFSEEMITMILPYVFVMETERDNNLKLDEALHKGTQEVIMRTQRVLEKVKGYNAYDSVSGTLRYPGNPWLYYGKYKFEFSDKIQAGVTVEKDPGEPFFKSSNRAGFDFNSAYLMANNVGFFKTILIGDFRLGFGQGLTLWNGAAQGKSSLPLNIIKRRDAIKPFTSSDENDYFRGLAASAKWGKFVLTGFYSSKKRDANITDTSATGTVYFSSFQEGGYHRTQAEVFDERAVRETVFGGNLVFRNNWLKVGTSFVQYYLNKYLDTGDELKDIYDFQGMNLLNLGIDYAVSVNKIQLFGETSFGNSSWATMNGALLTINKYASFSLLYRNYDKEYYALHSNAFSEGSSNTNEEALYAGAVIHPVRKLKISAYADFFRFPWLKSGVSAPATGNDFLLQADYSCSKQVQMYFRLKYKTNPRDNQVDSLLIPVIKTSRYTGIRYHIQYRLNERLALQNRLEMIDVEPENGSQSWGFLFYQDAEYRFGRIPLTLDFRFALFRTDDYSSRIYAYEQDLLTGFSYSPLSDEGYRTYLMAKYAITKKCSFMIRLSQSNYFKNATISSGYDEIGTNTRSDIKAQLTMRF